MELHKQFFTKNSNTSFFPIGSCCYKQNSMAVTSFFLIGCMTWQHAATCCYFGVALRNGIEHNSLSRSADGTPYSSSDLLTLLLPFTWTKLF